MENLLYYLLKANVVFTVIFMLYYLLLRKEKFLVANRVLLLVILAATVLLPLCPTFSYVGAINAQLPFVDIMQLARLNLHGGVNAGTATSDTSQVLTFTHITAFLYAAVAVSLSVCFIARLLRLSAIIRKSDRNNVGGIMHCRPVDAIAPFSFFKFIVVCDDTFSQEEHRQVILHETAHCRQLHSIDVLLTELTCVFLWMNPLAFIYRRQVKLNLEFLADEMVLKAGINRKSYQLNLLGNAAKMPAYALANSFRSSRIKQRISMMNRDNSPLKNRYKYVLVAPLLIVLYLVVNPPQAKSEVALGAGMDIKKVEGKRSQIPVAPKENLYDKPSLPTRKALAKHNTQQEKLPGIAIDARTDTVKIKTMNVDNSKYFDGIYVIDGKIYTDNELRAAIKSTGEFRVVFKRRPIIGAYTAHDANAIKTWGKRADKGVIFISPQKDPATNQ